jgi:hypothetical protein
MAMQIGKRNNIEWLIERRLHLHRFAVDLLSKHVQPLGAENSVCPMGG